MTAISEAAETVQVAGAHPAADIFPMMSAQELTDLVQDIEQHGLREPIWLHRDGRIIDGRNRYLACERAGVAVETRVYQGTDADLVEFVVSLNLHRRHLNESQRAMIAARIARYSHGGDRKSDQAANLPLETQARAASILGVSERSVRDAHKVQQSAPELAEAVNAGKVAVSAAALVADDLKDEIAGLKTDDVLHVVRQAVAEKRQRRATKQGTEKAEPESKRPPSRRPLLDAVRDTAFTALRTVEALERLRRDDRWKTNAPKIDPLTRDNLRRALELLEATVASIPVAETE